MNDDRYSELKENIPNKSDKNFTGVADGRYGENKNLYARADSLDAQTILKLEKEGFIVIHPELPKNPSESDKYICENASMIIDKVEEGKNPPTEVITAINSFYNMFGDRISQMKEDGSIAQNGSDGLKQIYDKIGIKYDEKENGDLNIKSSYERKTISKSKLSNIYEKSKGNIKNAFNNLKGFFKGKENEKNIDQESNMR